MYRIDIKIGKSEFNLDTLTAKISSPVDNHIMFLTSTYGNFQLPIYIQNKSKNVK